MTRSTTVNQETQMVEMEEQITVLQGSARRDEEKSREEINQNADESRNAILDELRSIFGATIPDKGKEVVGESSEGVGETPMAAGNLLYQLGGRGILPSPKGHSNPPLGDSNSTRFVVDSQGMPKFIPKIQLVSFDGEEPRHGLENSPQI